MAEQLDLDFDRDSSQDADNLDEQTRPTAAIRCPRMPAAAKCVSTRAPAVAPTPIAKPPAATLAGVIEMVGSQPGLDPSRRRDLISAVRTVARLCHMAPAQMPAAPAALRLHLHNVHPAAVGMSRKRFRNGMADLVLALRVANHRVRGRRMQVPFTPEWRALHDACPTKWCRYPLAALMRWCSEQGIEPAAVDTATLQAFMTDLDKTSLEPPSARLRGSIVSNWHRAVEAVPAWPRTRLELAPARVAWTLQWHRFTPAFRRDVDACLDRLAGSDPLDEDGPDKFLRPVTLKWRRFQIRMAASSLVAAGVPVEAIKGLDDVVRPEPFRRLIRNLVTRYGGKTANIYGLATALKSIACHHCKLDDDELDALRGICRKVRVKQRGLTRKNRDRLRPFTDPDTRDRLLLLPQKLMREASEAKKSGARDALTAQSEVKKPGPRDALAAQKAVALEIAQMAPLRAANLVALEVDRNLIFVGKGRHEYAVITIPEEEVKNEIALEYPLPPESTALIKRYITTFLPMLGQPGGKHLFPSPHGGAKRPNSLGNQIVAVVREATGHRIHLHLLRHFAAMIYLHAYPGAYEAVRRILGHATASAALNAYVGLETAAAARQFDEVILRHRRLALLRGGKVGRRSRR